MLFFIQIQRTGSILQGTEKENIPNHHVGDKIH